ncbi:MAG: hypothetical protein IJO20_03170 [Ruminococcus sp.]|nr:hypothetical protein [Ruminococcus sp.]
MGTLKGFSKDAYEIRVSSHKLLHKATQMRGIYSKISRHLKEIETELNNIDSYWESDNARLLLRLFKQEQVDSGVLESVFTSQIDNLNQIIALYEDAEESNITTALTLPNDILS